MTDRFTVDRQEASGKLTDPFAGEPHLCSQFVKIGCAVLMGDTAPPWIIHHRVLTAGRAVAFWLCAA